MHGGDIQGMRSAIELLYEQVLQEHLRSQPGTSGASVHDCFDSLLA